MNNQALPAGSRVRVISYGPFRGLKGTIRKVDTIASLEADEAFCFYLVELEGTHIKEPIWFQYDEVELVVCPALDDERDLELIPKPAKVILPCSMRLETGSPSSSIKLLEYDHTAENREERKPDAGRLRMFG